MAKNSNKFREIDFEEVERRRKEKWSQKMAFFDSVKSLMPEDIRKEFDSLDLLSQADDSRWNEIWNEYEAQWNEINGKATNPYWAEGLKL